MDKLTIIIPVYNDGNTLRRAVISALNSNYSNFEVIVVDDGSTDGGIDNISDLLGINSNLLLVTQENKGLAAARDAGIKKSSGKWVTFLDADDEIDENKVREQVNVLTELSDINTIVFTGVKMINESGNERYVCCNENINKAIDITDEYCKRNVRPPTASFMFSRSLYNEIGGFKLDLKAGTEEDYLARLIANGVTIKLIAKPMYIQYLRSDSLRNRGEGRVAAYKELLCIFHTLLQSKKDETIQQRLKNYIEGKALEIWSASLNWDYKIRKNIMIILINKNWLPLHYRLLFILTIGVPSPFDKFIKKNISKKNW
jgi:glycosyltransferase involved in cell wall biosynthesis